MCSSGDETRMASELESLLQQAEAGRVLDRLERGGGVPPGRLQAARDGYQQLQRGALRALSDLAALQQRMGQLLAQLRQVEAQGEMVQQGDFTDPVQVLDKFREDRERARREAALAADNEEAARQQAEALQQRLAHLPSKLTEAEDERRAELAPDIKAAKDEIAGLQGQLAAERAKAAAAQREASDIAARLETLQLDIGHLHSALDEEREAATRADGQPSRSPHQADLAVAALRVPREEEAELAAQLRVQEAAEAAQLQETKELLQQHAVAVKANDRLGAQAGVRERAAEEVARDIEMVQIEREKLLAEQVTWDLEVEKKRGEAKREADAVKCEQRGREVAQRLNRAELEVKQLAEQLPGLQNTVANMGAQLAAEQRQAVQEVAAGRKLAAEVTAMVGEVAAEKQLSEAQTALVKASLADVRQLDEECADLQAAAAERQRAIRAAVSQRDAAVRFLNQRLKRLGEVIEEAEAKDGELDELRKKQRQVKSAHRDVRELCGIMSGEMGRFKSLLEFAEKSSEGMVGRVAEAERELAGLKQAAEGGGVAVRVAERARAASQADKALLTAQLAAQRRAAAAVAEAADVVQIERGLVARGAEEASEACTRLRSSKAAALAAKQATQRGLLERSEEMCGLYERSTALQQELDGGTVALQQCDDDMRLLQLEVAELQRRMFATHKTAPDSVAYDRQIAALKAEVLRARREANSFGSALESPSECAKRWRVLPGKLPSKEDLAARTGQIEERLAAQRDLAAQKDSVLEELERLTEGLAERAHASHDPALGLSLRMDEARLSQQQLTRRMMATVSELSLYQALSLKFAADKEALRAELAAAQQNVAAGRPPNAGADQEYARMERDRAVEAEVRAQAAELRQLRADGQLGAAAQLLRTTASPRPQAYTPPDELGLPKPFPAAFRPVKPAELPAAVALAAQAHSMRAAASAAAQQWQHQQQQMNAAAALACRGSSPAPCPAGVSVG